MKLKSKSTTVSTAISFMLIVVSLAVASGFRHEIAKSVSDMCGDFRVIPVSGLGEAGSDPVDCSQAVFDSVRAVRGVAALRPVIYRGGIMSSGTNMHGVIFRGTENFAAADSLVSIPSKLASLLCLEKGDRVPAYFVSEDIRVRMLTVNDIYEGIVTSDDKLVVNCNASLLRILNGWRDGEASSAEIVLDEENAAQTSRDEVEYELNRILYNDATEGRTLICENVRSSYSQLFEWLNLIDSNVTLILALMIIAAGFNMVTGLLIFIFNNVKAIGVFKSLGMKNSDISKSFLLSAGRSVIIGMLVGNTLAIAFCIFQAWSGALTLNPDNYFVSFVPVRLEIAPLVCCNIVAFAAIMLILTIPCAYISRIEPSVTLKSE